MKVNHIVSTVKSFSQHISFHSLSICMELFVKSHYVLTAVTGELNYHTEIEISAIFCLIV